MGLIRYSKLSNNNIKREIVLLKSFPCEWGKCSFCDYIKDNSTDEQLINTTNKEILANVTGCYSVLQVINSASCFELPSETILSIKLLTEKLKIKKLFFESHWVHRDKINDFKKVFSIPLIISLGLETFDNHFRNQILKKGIHFKEITEITEHFNAICLMVGIEGQNKEMISHDIELALKHFEYTAINLFIPNSTQIKPDLKLQSWFKQEYSWLTKEKKVDVLFDITDFGVG